MANGHYTKYSISKTHKHVPPPPRCNIVPHGKIQWDSVRFEKIWRASLRYCDTIRVGEIWWTLVRSLKIDMFTYIWHKCLTFLHTFYVTKVCDIGDHIDFEGDMGGWIIFYWLYHIVQWPNDFKNNKTM